MLRVQTCWRNSLSAFAAAKTGHADIATIMAKRALRWRTPRFFRRRDKIWIAREMTGALPIFGREFRLTIVRFTVIAVMTGTPIKQKCGASGYELLKPDDDLVTTGRMPM